MNNEITNSQDVIDSRDIIARIEELEGELTEIAEQEWLDADEESDDLTLNDWMHGLEGVDHSCSEAIEEYKMLKALADEGEASPDWQYGEALIRDSYFEDYAQQTAEDCGMINDNASWPNTCIDWEEAADQLKQDYFSVDFDGVEYWIRG